MILICIPIFGFSQIEKKNSKKVFAKFEKLYNLNNYQKIFNLYSQGMKSHLSLENTFSFLTEVKREYGKILNHTFIGYESYGYASYKTELEFGIAKIKILSIEKRKISGLIIAPLLEDESPNIERNETEFILPFKGEWFVKWGGNTKELNHHYHNSAQKRALDIEIQDKYGKTYKNKGATNEDYYAFGEELIAPCDAVIVAVIDGIKDNKPGEFNRIYIYGNSVVLKTEKEEYIFLNHFKKNSIVVKEGQKVKQGELLGLCGNSGNSSEPHLHFHIQNIEDPNKATGIKSFFKNIIVNEKLKEDYSPIKGDKIRNN